LKEANRKNPESALMMGEGASHMKRLGALAGHGVLLSVTSLSAVAVLFIFYFVFRDALPFFKEAGRLSEFFTGVNWYPSAREPHFGSLPIILGSVLVTVGAILFSAPLGLAAALCLSDVLSFSTRQIVKPIIEMLAAIPSVAYGFFALVVMAPLFQNEGGKILAGFCSLICFPLLFLLVMVLGDLLSTWIQRDRIRLLTRIILSSGIGIPGLVALGVLVHRISQIQISSGTNALNASIILGIMALPTIVSVSEDALSAVGRDLREGSYAMGATRVETLFKVIVPAAGSGILAAVLLGLMRAVGETMVVWMAAGNAAHIPQPWYNLLEPVRTLTATIAGDMGETEIGSAHYHLLFAMGLLLLSFSFLSNLVSEWAVRRSKAKSA